LPHCFAAVGTGITLLTLAKVWLIKNSAKEGKLKRKPKGMAENLGSTQFANFVCCSSETDEQSLIPKCFMRYGVCLRVYKTFFRVGDYFWLPFV